MGWEVQIVALTHRGVVREHNEDSICVGAWVRSEPMIEPRDTRHALETPFVVLVCDGLGGHQAGEVASGLAARVLSLALNSEVSAATVIESVGEANREVFAAAETGEGSRGMGSTVAGLCFGPQGLIWFNVGDSPIFRYRDGFARQLSIDDVRSSEGGRRRNGPITQALGGADRFVPVEVHIGEEPLIPGWKYLLCSDGLTDMLSLEEIERALASPPQSAVVSLFDAAMAAGGEDNISIVLASMEATAEG